VTEEGPRRCSEVFVRREDAERFIEDVRGDEPEVVAKLRIEERKLDAGDRAEPTNSGLAQPAQKHQDGEREL
jgi:hypothetical protein